MLRIGFLPSDFHPMLLILGEAEDFRSLAAVLRRFAADRTPVALHALPGTVAAVALTLEPSAVAGLARRTAAEFAWRLDAATASDFAGRAAALAVSSLRAGADFLTCGGADEIPVKLSRGEYTDDFLLPPCPPDPVGAEPPSE